MKEANTYLRELYLEYVNNYLTVAKMAEHHQMSEGDLSHLLSIGHDLHEEFVKLNK